MRRTILICLALVSAAALMVPAAAGAAKSKKGAKASTPTITRVTPMRVARRRGAHDPGPPLQGPRAPRTR